LALRLSPREKMRGVATLRGVKAVLERAASLLAAALVLWSFDLIVFTNALITWFPFLLSFKLLEAPYERMQ